MGVDSSSRLTTLTTDFHEFIGKVTQENQAVLQYGPFFQWSEKVRQDNPVPSGPLNPQALNRYAYCLNSPLRYVDPTGHAAYVLTKEQIEEFIKIFDTLAVVTGVGVGSVMIGIDWLSDYATPVFPQAGFAINSVAHLGEFDTAASVAEYSAIANVFRDAAKVAEASPDGTATLVLSDALFATQFYCKEVGVQDQAVLRSNTFIVPLSMVDPLGSSKSLGLLRWLLLFEGDRKD